MQNTTVCYCVAKMSRNIQYSQSLIKCYSVPKVELSNNVQFFLGNEAKVGKITIHNILKW